LRSNAISRGKEQLKSILSNGIKVAESPHAEAFQIPQRSGLF
jgi:hypothetical protein